MTDPFERQVGESYKDYADRMHGCARAMQIDLDCARVQVEDLRRRNHQQGLHMAALSNELMKLQAEAEAG